MTIPNNLADAAAAIRDGEFGLPENVMIGDLVVSALIDVDYTDNSTVTKKRVEAGYTVSDAVVDLPDEVGLFICLANPDYSVEAGLTAALSGDVTQLVETYREKRDYLYALKAEKELIEVIVHDGFFTSMIVQSISPRYDVDENYDCFFCYVRLVEIQGYAVEETTGVIDSDIANAGGL